MTRLRKFSLHGLVLVSGILLCAGCDKAGVGEKTGKKVDQATEQARAKLKDLGTSIGDKTEGTAEYLDDAAITAKIKGDILADPLLKVLEISVKTLNGVVTLSGTVDTKLSVDRAEEVVRLVKGVKSLDNKLVVKTAS
jgi:hyperosmotically inducible periplasmic protein